MAILVSNSIDLNIAKLKKELEHLTTTEPFTTKPLKVLSIVPGNPSAPSPDNKTSVTIVTTLGTEPTEAQLTLAQQILDTHTDRNQQDENVKLISKNQTVIGNAETGQIVLKNNNQDVWKIKEDNSLVPANNESYSIGSAENSILSIHTKNITVTSTITSPNVDLLETRVEALETDPTTKSYVDTTISNLVGGAPELLNTLAELSQALNNEEDFGVIVNQRLNDLDTDIQNESINRDTAFQTAQNLINGEISTREAEDLLIRQSILDESVSRTSSDLDLDNRITTVETDLQSVESSLVTELSSLNDVTLTNPTNNQVLKYNGTSWINSDAPSTFSGSYNDLTDQPALSTVATTGSYTDLLSIPSFSTIATSGSYNDLTDQPTLSTVATSGSYVDLLNKPSLATVATSGSYTDLTGKPNLNAITATSSGSVALSINGVASQSANLLELKNSSGSVVMSVNVDGSIESSAWNGQPVDISKGGTGATSEQTAINLLSQVSLATSGHVLTKDVATGNATWKAITSTTFALPDGSVASPALYFTSDTNTGLYRKGNDLIGFVANGQPGLTVDGTSGVGRLSIGDINFAASRLQLVDDNNNAASGITLGASSSTYVQLYKSASNTLTIAGAVSATGNITTSGGVSATGNITTSGGVIANGNVVINNSTPTIYFQDTDNRSAMIYCNANLLYFLRGAGNNSQNWETLNGNWPLTINLETNEAIFGGNVVAIGSVYANYLESAGVGSVGSNLTVGADINIAGMITSTGTDVGITSQNWLCKLSSSLRYKTNIEDILPEYSEKVLNLRPIWYRANQETTADTRPDWSWFGLIAEEVAEVEPRLVNFEYAPEDIDKDTKQPKEGAELRAESVVYSRISVLLLGVVKRQKDQIQSLEERLSQLEAVLLNKQ